MDKGGIWWRLSVEKMQERGLAKDYDDSSNLRCAVLLRTALPVEDRRAQCVLPAAVLAWVEV